MSLAGSQHVLVHDEYPILAGRYDLHNFLRPKPAGGREATFHEGRLVDVVVLWAGEDEVLRQQPFLSRLVLTQIGVKSRSYGVGVVDEGIVARTWPA